MKERDPMFAGDPVSDTLLPPKSAAGKPLPNNVTPLSTPLMEQGKGAAYIGKPRGTAVSFFADDVPIAIADELIRETMQASGIGFIGGQSGMGKTFLSIDLAFCIGLGMPFAGRKIEKTGGVLLFAFEGANSISGRVKAKRSTLPDPECELPFTAIQDFNSLTGENDIQDFYATIDAESSKFKALGLPLRMVVIDTISATGLIPDDKENDPAIWTRINNIMQAVIRKHDCVVALVHHYGKSADAGLRGSSNARAIADFIIALTGERNELTGEVAGRQLALTKHRDAPEGLLGSVDLTPIQITVRADGSPVYSCVLSINEGARTAAATGRLNQAAKTLLEAYSAAIEAHGEPVKPLGHADAPTVTAVRVDFVKPEFDRRYTTGSGSDDPVKRKDTVRKQLAAALAKKDAAGLCGGSWDGNEWLWKA